MMGWWWKQRTDEGAVAHFSEREAGESVCGVSQALANSRVRSPHATPLGERPPDSYGAPCPRCVDIGIKAFLGQK